MKVFKGKGVYGAVASGKISVFKKQNITIKRVHCANSKSEIVRVESAKAKTLEQLQ